VHGLHACCCPKKYVVETLKKMLSEMPEPIFIDPAIVQMPILGWVNYVVNPPLYGECIDFDQNPSYD